MEARDARKMSPAEYVALDRASDERWEYVDGEAFAMAGASPRHGAIVGNVYHALRTKLAGSPCVPHLDGVKVATEATGSFHQPDLAVVCGRPRYSAIDEYALTNPTLLVEVLSPSTAAYDRSDKFDHYKSVPELREYVVVFSDTRRVEHRKRLSDTQWLTTDFIGGVVPLESLGVSLSLDEIYEDLERVEP